MFRSLHRTLAVLLALACLVAACGDDDDAAVSGTPASVDDDSGSEDSDEAGSDEATFPVTVTVDGVDVTIDDRPEAIVSLSPSSTEMLFAVGAGDQVVAVDDFSDFPEDAPTTDLSGFEPNLEAILEYEPDLVLLSGDRNDVIAGLDAVEVPWLILPAAADLDDTYTQIELLGAATGHVGDAAELVANMQTDIDALVERIPEDAAGLTYFHELDDQLFTVTSDTFIGQLYALVGLENVADPADPDGAAGGYPQLSAEFLVDADPDLVFLADTKCCGQDADTFGARAGFGDLTAVQEGNVVLLDDDIASRWGPRVVDFLAAIVEAVEAADVAVPAG